MDKILSKDTIKNVFSALGAKTSDSNYGVALLDKTSGEPKGFMGMSDLASVLDGQLVIPAANVNPDTLTALGVTYQVQVNSSGAGYPFSIGYAVIKNERAGGNRLVQNLYHIGFGDSYSRTRDDANAWTSWSRLDNFGCNTAADLASLLGVFKNQGRPSEKDANNITISGIYQDMADMTNMPTEGSYYAGWGNLIVFSTDGYVIQLYCGGSGSGTRCYIRYSTANSWYEWKLLATFA